MDVNILIVSCFVFVLKNNLCQRVNSYHVLEFDRKQLQLLADQILNVSFYEGIVDNLFTKVPDEVQHTLVKSVLDVNVTQIRSGCCDPIHHH